MIDTVVILYIMYIYNLETGLRMRILISNTGDTPIYEQIVSQIKAAILSAELLPGDPLPSMRLLAKELRISVITTKRAYEELEREGFIVSMTGKGSFVKESNTQLMREELLRRLEQGIVALLPLARQCSLTINELQEMLSLLYEEDQHATDTGD